MSYYEKDNAFILNFEKRFVFHRQLFIWQFLYQILQFLYKDKFSQILNFLKIYIILLLFLALPPLCLSYVCKKNSFICFCLLLVNWLSEENQSEAVAQRCSVKTLLLEISKNSHESTCARVFNKVAGQRPTALLKKETLTQVFSGEFGEISKNTFSYRTTPVAASDQFIFLQFQKSLNIYQRCTQQLVNK